MQTLTIVAQLVAKADAIERVKCELLNMVAPTRQENGCITYTLQQDNENPEVFVFYETWQDAVALDRHLQSEHFCAYVKALDGLLESKRVNHMTRIA